MQEEKMWRAVKVVMPGTRKTGEEKERVLCGDMESCRERDWVWMNYDYIFTQFHPQ